MQGQYTLPANNTNTILQQPIPRTNSNYVEQLNSVVNRDRENQDRPEEQQQEQQQGQQQEQRQQTPAQQPLGEGPQQGIEIVLQQLALAIGNMNQPAAPREIHVVSYPIFRGGEQDPNQWWQEFEYACVANQVPEYR